MSQDDLVDQLQSYQDRLAAAEKQGPASFEAAFQSPPAGVGVHELDTKGIIRRVNRGELRLLGYRESDLVGKPAWNFIVMEETSRRAVQQKLAGVKELKPFVRTFRTASGAGLALILLDRRLYDAKGEVIGLRTAMTPANAVK